MSSGGKRLRAGWTLLETLVALTLFAILLVVTIPVVTQQIDRIPPVRVARDLRHIKSALQMFRTDVRYSPLYIVQATRAITTRDSTLAYPAFGRYSRADSARWNGPYIAMILPDTLTIATAQYTGWNGVIDNDLLCYDPPSGFPGTCGPGMWVAVRVDGLTAPQFFAVNDILDGPEAHDASATGAMRRGNLRFVQGIGVDLQITVGIMFYMLWPWDGH